MLKPRENAMAQTFGLFPCLAGGILPGNGGGKFPPVMVLAIEDPVRQGSHEICDVACLIPEFINVDIAQQGFPGTDPGG